jgi:hypothetical protein
MQIIKYFFEEPAALEGFDQAVPPLPSLPLTADDVWHLPRYYRGYLTGTDLTTGRFGLTALPAAPRIMQTLIGWQSGCTWQYLDQEHQVHHLPAHAVALHLAQPSDCTLLVGTPTPVAPETLAATGVGERRSALPALRAVLDTGAVALYPEPAHHGYDWSLFSAHPMQAALAQVFQSLCSPGLRVFIIPFAQARSEEKFYFETYDLERYRAYEL